MTPAAQLALIAMIGSTLALLIAGIFKLKTMERRAAREALKREADARQRDKKLDELHVLINGNLTKLLVRVAKLTQIVADNDPGNQEKALAASDAAEDLERKDASDHQAAAVAAKQTDKPKGT